MSSFAIKLVAIIAMLIDHIGAVLLPHNTSTYFLCRAIGRLAFPLFVFLIVEGFYYTRNVYKYMLRLGLFALISEIPFDLAFNGKILEFTHQNVFFTLVLGLMMLTIYHKLETLIKPSYLSSLLQAMTLIGFCGVAYLLKTDYDYIGIIMIMIFYLFRKKNHILLASVFAIYLYMYSSNLQNTISWLYIIFATLSMILVYMYNGKKGKDIKYLFYIFYPGHLIVLYLIKTYL